MWKKLSPKNHLTDMKFVCSSICIGGTHELDKATCKRRSEAKSYDELKKAAVTWPRTTGG